MAVIELERLQDIFSYANGPDQLDECILVVTGKDEVHSMFEKMTQADYKRLREIIINQNDLNFKALRESQAGTGKNVSPLPSV